MGLSGALNIAASGLRTTQNWADITSRNIANAATEGYARKDVQMGTLSGGVEISAVRREVNAAMETLDRGEVSKLARWSTITDGLEVYTASLGQPSDEISPAFRLARFQESLNALANKPGDAATQAAVLDSGKRLTEGLNDAAAMLARVGAEVELQIRYDVADLNELTQTLAQLNDRVLRSDPGSIGHAELKDEMGRIVDRVAGFLDIRTTTGADGRIGLYTAGGTMLVEGDAAALVRYDQATGILSAGTGEITPAKAGVRGFQYGSLAGLFTLKNETLPGFGLQLDDMARALVQGFEGADASLAPGQAGLFTDAGAAYATTPGLAARIAVNPTMDPGQGGTLSRFRDGAGAVTAGAAGDPTQVMAFIDLFNAPQAFDPATGIGSSMTLDAYATAMVTKQATTQSDARAAHQSAALSADAFSSARWSYAGVNTDDELQRLMLIEQSYAANAKMMTTVSQMLDALLAAV